MIGSTMFCFQVGQQQQVKHFNTSSDHDVASAVLTDILGRFLFQRRDDVPGILSPGKVGLFGGHRETGETYLQYIVREVHEEIGYFVHPERFQFLAPYQRLDPVHRRIRGELFIAYGAPTAMLRITEGYASRTRAPGPLGIGPGIHALSVGRPASSFDRSLKYRVSLCCLKGLCS